MILFDAVMFLGNDIVHEVIANNVAKVRIGEVFIVMSNFGFR
jgi:hypothetical protein